MNALLILDKDSKTELSEDLKAKICRILKEKGHRIETVELGKNEVAPCLGLDCFQCVTKHPGECVSKDAVYPIKKNIRKYDLALFLTPVLFGHFSSPVKNAIDRGAGSHNRQVIIGYGNNIDDEEKSTFIDLTAKHRGNADIVHPGMDRQVDVFVTRSVEENTTICEALIQTREIVRHV
jgi:multimeric flavodoxin WrbA